MIAIARHPIFQIILFWAFSFWVLHRVFTVEYDNGLIDIYYTILFHLPLLFIVHANFFSIQKLLIDRNNLGYYLASILTIIISGILLHRFAFDYLSDLIFPDYYLVSNYSNKGLFEIMAGYLLVSTLLYFSRNWFLLKEKQLKLEQENNSVKRKALQSQINPHFLFNNLNNIYAFTDPKDKKARNYILKLSDALRYMIYETEAKEVLLEQEIEYIDNYINLEKLRLENPDAVQFSTEGNFSGYLISPLLLLPLIENCFKHYDADNPMIDIQLKIKDKQLIVLTKNNTILETERKVVGGLGLQNLRNRLQLLYPNCYSLETKIEQNIFIAQMSLNL